MRTSGYSQTGKCSRLSHPTTKSIAFKTMAMMGCFKKNWTMLYHTKSDRYCFSASNGTKPILPPGILADKVLVYGLLYVLYQRHRLVRTIKFRTKQYFFKERGDTYLPLLFCTLSLHASKEIIQKLIFWHLF